MIHLRLSCAWSVFGSVTFEPVACVYCATGWELQCDSVNLHVVHLNIKKNNNICVRCCVVVLTCLVNVLIRRTDFLLLW
jgi:hypothetical protein